MKNSHSIPLLLALIFLPLHSRAADIDSIVSSVMEHNPTVLKYRAQAEAVKAGNSVGLTLADPEVEFNYLWGSPQDVGQRKDISVTQRFDYATLFGLKRKEARRKDELADMEYAHAELLLRHSVLQLFTDIATANAVREEYAMRLSQADRLCAISRKKLSAGATNKIELNKSLLNLALVQAEASEAETARQQLFVSPLLACLSDEHRKAVAGITSDDIEAYLATTGRAGSMTHIETAMAEQRMRVAQAGLKTARATNIPELTAGYMSELTRGEKFRGITVGLSIPLWSGRRNIASAKAQVAAASAEREETHAAVTARRNALRCRIESLSMLRASLTESIRAASSDALLVKALEEGSISMTEYISELSAYYDLRRRLIDTTHEYYSALAEMKLMY